MWDGPGAWWQVETERGGAMMEAELGGSYTVTVRSGLEEGAGRPHASPGPIVTRAVSPVSPYRNPEPSRSPQKTPHWEQFMNSRNLLEPWGAREGPPGPAWLLFLPSHAFSQPLPVPVLRSP